jgi:hypothetical protein
LTRRHIVRRLSGSEILLADQIYPSITNGQLFTDEPIADPRLAVYWDRVGQDQFSPITPVEGPAGPVAQPRNSID